MRRPAPRPLTYALAAEVDRTTPQTTLARAQACWEHAVGPAVAGQAWPLAERDGTLTVGCRTATWASELELLAPDLLAALNATLGEGGEGPLRALRTRVADPP